MTKNAITKLRANLHELIENDAPYEAVLIVSQRLDRLIVRAAKIQTMKGVNV